MKLRMDVYHHFEAGSADRKLDQILARLEILMAKADEIATQLDEIDTQTNEIAADIDALLQQGLTGLTEAEAEAIKARLGTHAETLRGIAAKS